MPGIMKLTISITAAGAIDIDCAGKKGGHIRGKPLRRVRWSKDGTVDRFDLKFERFDGEDGPLSKESDWPFIDARPVPETIKPDEDAGTVTGVEKFFARLADEGVYKYTVTAYRGAATYTLDPMVIVK